MNLPEYALAQRGAAAPTTDEREHVAQALCLHFATGNIGMESLDQRLAGTYAAATFAELQGVLSDLPMLASDQLDPGAAPLIAPSHLVPPRGVVMAVMGGLVRKGGWLIPRHMKIFAILGGAEIDLRDAKFGAGVTEMDVTAFMGGVEITVPLGVRVEVMGGAFMGGFDSDAGDAGALDPSQPVLRVTGMAIMGGVEVKVRRPGKRVMRRFEQAVEAARQLPADIARHG